MQALPIDRTSRFISPFRTTTWRFRTILPRTIGSFGRAWTTRTICRTMLTISSSLLTFALALASRWWSRPRLDIWSPQKKWRRASKQRHSSMQLLSRLDRIKSPISLASTSWIRSKEQSTIREKPKKKKKCCDIEFTCFTDSTTMRTWKSTEGSAWLLWESEKAEQISLKTFRKLLRLVIWWCESIPSAFLECWQMDTQTTGKMFERARRRKEKLTENDQVSRADCFTRIETTAFLSGWW